LQFAAAFVNLKYEIEMTFQIQPDTLRHQAEVAKDAGYTQLAENLRRAAELTAVPNETLLKMYELLRPGRSTQAELLAMAETLERDYNAVETAGFVREASAVYAERNLFKRD
jgi:propanediol dehydratase small subunit